MGRCHRHTGLAAVGLEGGAAGLPGGPHLPEDPARPKVEEVLLWTIPSFVRCHLGFRG